MDNRSIHDNGILWKPDKGSSDTVEMSGNCISAIVTYGKKEDEHVLLRRELRFPKLRTLPKNTHSTLGRVYEHIQSFKSDRGDISESVKEIYFDGMIRIRSVDKDIEITRFCFPDMKLKLYIEYCIIKNIGHDDVHLWHEAINDIAYTKGAEGTIRSYAVCDKLDVVLEPGETAFSVLRFYAGYKYDEDLNRCTDVEASDCLRGRREYIRYITEETLVLESSDKELDRMFAFSKLRACESIFDTFSGPLHSPGGGAYYSAVWTNDQAEYASPFFPYTGYTRSIEASVNMFRLYERYMDSDYTSIPSSVIDEGHDIWEGAGDRGDSAMYLYGITRFLLTLGDKKLALSFMPAIEWCIEYCMRKKNKDGVIGSDSDELEGRFPAGKANLCTSSLCYGGLVSASNICKALGDTVKGSEYMFLARELRKSINSFFGVNISGYEAYRYYEGNDKLRSWICIPLTMGITERAEGCVDALLSDKLWSQDGLLCQEGDVTYWDRSTLYALRGILYSGYQERVCSFLKHYVHTRLLGDHIPYPIEAYPEGNKRHLSAESALFARVIIEGLLGITPVSFDSIELRPNLPKAIGYISLKKVHACSCLFDVTVTRTDTCYEVVICTDQSAQKINIPFGKSSEITLASTPAIV